MAYQTFAERSYKVAWNGSRLRKIRNLKDLRQVDAAGLMNQTAETMGLKHRVSIKMISDYERGVEQPRADVLAIICRALKVDPKYLLELSDFAILLDLTDLEYATILKNRKGKDSAADEFILKTIANSGFDDK